MKSDSGVSPVNLRRTLAEFEGVLMWANSREVHENSHKLAEKDSPPRI